MTELRKFESSQFFRDMLKVTKVTDRRTQMAAVLYHTGFSLDEIVAVIWNLQPNSPRQMQTIIGTADSLQHSADVHRILDQLVAIETDNEKKIREQVENEIVQADTISLIDKEQTAKELLRMAQKMPDCKERGDLLARYSDIMGFKKTDNNTDKERVVYFYLPAQCDSCPIRKWVAKNNPEVLKSRKPKKTV